MGEPLPLLPAVGSAQHVSHTARLGSPLTFHPTEEGGGWVDWARRDGPPRFLGGAPGEGMAGGCGDKT